MQDLTRQPDGWDIGKLLCALGMVAGGIAALSGEKKGGPLFVASLLGELSCNAFEPPVCNSCDTRTTYQTSIRGFQCPSCLKLVPRFLA